MTKHFNELMKRMEKRKKWIEYMKLLDELREKHEKEVNKNKDGKV